MRRIVVGFVLLLGIALVVIQVVPYGRNHDNPPVVSEPAWDSQATRDLAVRACYDCHSNEVVWPWYSNVAPVSWLVQWDVDRGRDELNFSEWGVGGQGEGDDDLAESVLEGEMPMFIYLVTHPNARLSGTEKDALVAGLRAISGTGGGAGEREHDDEDD